MRIKLADNASAAYVRRCYRGAHPACGRIHRPEWAEMLSKVQGQWLEVETDYLFADQFNTAPIPGVSDLGMRIMGADVAEVEGDVRPGVIKDRWSGKCYMTEAEIPAEALTPERIIYLKVFTPYPEGRGVHLLEKQYKPSK